MTPSICTVCLRPFVAPHECAPQEEDGELFRLAFLLLRSSVIRVRSEQRKKEREEDPK